MRWVLFAILLGHGLIHLLGVAKGFGLAELQQLRMPVSRAMAIVWLAAGVLFAAAAAMLLALPQWWWAAGLLAVALSQAAIVTSWHDAKFGTIANAVALVAAIHGLASQGPASLRAEYREAVAARRQSSHVAEVLRESDLAPLPEPVRCWVRASGALGRPRPTHVEATWRGRIRGAADDPWMELTAEQHNVFGDPARFFFMEASRGGLPVDVLHVFRGGAATMRVRLLSLVPLVDAAGPDLTLAETVTLLNDMSMLAPGALVDPAIRWEPIDARSARAHYTVGANTIAATLVFDGACDLVDFVSEDRLVADADGQHFTRRRWSTPLTDHRGYGTHRAPGRGEARWHPDAGAFTYIELELVDLRID